jgi:hypothetical protein
LLLLLFFFKNLFFLILSSPLSSLFSILFHRSLPRLYLFFYLTSLLFSLSLSLASFSLPFFSLLDLWISEFFYLFIFVYPLLAYFKLLFLLIFVNFIPFQYVFASNFNSLNFVHGIQEALSV